MHLTELWWTCQRIPLFQSTEKHAFISGDVRILKTTKPNTPTKLETIKPPSFHKGPPLDTQLLGSTDCPLRASSQNLCEHTEIAANVPASSHEPMTHTTTLPGEHDIGAIARHFQHRGLTHTLLATPSHGGTMSSTHSSNARTTKQPSPLSTLPDIQRQIIWLCRLYWNFCRPNGRRWKYLLSGGSSTLTLARRHESGIRFHYAQWGMVPCWFPHGKKPITVYWIFKIKPGLPNVGGQTKPKKEVIFLLWLNPLEEDYPFKGARNHLPSSNTHMLWWLAY